MITDGLGEPTAPRATQWLVLLLLAALLFFTKLTSPLLEPEEARYAEIPRQMLSRGHVAVPVLHGLPYYHKPPMLYWLVMAGYRAFGVHDWAARLVPGGCGVLVVLLVYSWGGRAFGHRAGFLAGSILCLWPRFLYLGRMLTTDALLTLFVTASLLAAYRAVAGAALRRWWLAAALACGLGVLTKGPVALALVTVPVLGFQLLDRRTARPALLPWAGFVLLALAVALPWYGFLAWHDPDAFATFFWLHNVQRFVDPLDHAEPFWFYLPGVTFGLLPWSLLFLPLARDLYRRDERLRPARPALLFFLLASLWCLCFFSCSGCKRPVYILPALPPLAAALGIYLASTVTWTAGLFGFRTVPLPAERSGLGRWAALACLAAATAVAGAATVPGLWRPQEGGAATAGLLALLWLVHQFGRRLSAPAAWAGAALVLFGLQLGAVCFLLPDYNRRFALRADARHAEEYRAGPCPVLTYPRRWDSISFYLRRDDVQAYSGEQLPAMIRDLKNAEIGLVFVKGDASLDAFLAALPPGLEFVPHPRQREKVRVGVVRPRATGHGGS